MTWALLVPLLGSFALFGVAIWAMAYDAGWDDGWLGRDEGHLSRKQQRRSWRQEKVRWWRRAVARCRPWGAPR